ncbi:hypothetical protein FLJC2902T_17920 [Flavobacterium limnosediminis JC2902]|uniref:DUF937 domain-containing protein n=1 Tax=Flavobacterium limnosediminis JC2902 TaxID=1341181 RepID=V6SP80_9FLAO|nr:hypothetical protein [Flavobacterium limnosediminis]ESU28431.1 hypothetical protein FLJC2902T_17920 [Flavobacterium limnosediminis JC2902]
MLDQISELVKQFGGDAIVNNQSVPNEHNEAVMNETGNSILSGLKNMVAEGNVNDIAGLLKGGTVDASNPVVKQLTDQLSGNLGQKFGLSSDTASGVAGSMIPKVLGSLIGKANDPNQPGFNVSDIVNSLGGNSGLMEAVSKYGGQFGLDQNKDGKVDMNDATAALSGKSGGFLSGILGKLFGK